jgi:DNA-binding transcriptional ArsR family regulator
MEAKGRRRAAKGDRRELIDKRLVKAISHPLRVEILIELAKAPMSPIEFSRLSGVSLSDSAYHFRTLLRNDCVEIADEQQKRGAVEHIYRLTKRALLSDDDFAQLPALLAGGFDASILTTFMQQGQQALEAETMESQVNKHLTWQSLKLDKEGFDNLMERLIEVYEMAGAEQLAAKTRLKESGEQPVFTTLGMFGFESPTPERNHDLPEE